jgi:hypothetical protein
VANVGIDRRSTREEQVTMATLSPRAAKTTKPAKTTSQKPAITTASVTLLLPEGHTAASFVAEHQLLLQPIPITEHRLPPNVLVHHGKLLLDAVKPHTSALLAVGLDPMYLSELPKRILLVQATQTLRQMQRTSYTAEENATIEKAEAHRREMMRIARYAFRALPDVQQTLTKIQEGSGVADTIEDFGALIHLFTEHRALVTKVRVDVDATIATARDHVRTLSEVASLRTRRAKGGLSEVILRKKAMAYALEALREVRDAATFALASDEKLMAVLQGLGTLERATREAAMSEDDTEEDTSIDDDTEEDSAPTE